MHEFFGYDYCILLTIDVFRHVEFKFIQLLNLLKNTMSIYIIYLLSLSSHKIV